MTNEPLVTVFAPPLGVPWGPGAARSDERDIVLGQISSGSPHCIRPERTQGRGVQGSQGVQGSRHDPRAPWHPLSGGGECSRESKLLVIC